MQGIIDNQHYIECIFVSMLTVCHCGFHTCSSLESLLLSMLGSLFTKSFRILYRENNLKIEHLTFNT